jgi:hypothetical protein
MTDAQCDSLTGSHAPDPLSDLWEWAAMIFHEVTSAFGTPHAIAVQVWHNRVDHRLLTDWIDHFEMLVRRILLVAALALAPALAHRLTLGRPSRPSRPRAPPPVYSNPLLPQTWDACFVFLRDSRASIRRQAASRRRMQRTCFLTLRLAQRLESLRRIIAEPLVAATRCARQLVRLKARAAGADASPCIHLHPWVMTPGIGATGRRLVGEPMRIVTALAEAALPIWTGTRQPDSS